MLFKDFQTLKKYSDVANGAAFERIKTIMETVEKNTIVSILGKALYQTLNNAVDAGNVDANVKLKILLDPVRKVLGPLVVYHYAPFSELNMGDSGLHRTETGNAKTAFGYQSYNYRKENMRLAEIATEQLYEFLEENKTDYPEWTDSKAYTNYSSLIIRSGREFGQLFTSHSPYRNYYAMRSKMADVELLYISSAINAEVFTFLRQSQDDKVIPENPTIPEGYVAVAAKDINKAVLMLKKAIAYYTVAFAVPYLNVRIDEDGITVVSDNSSKEADNRKEANAEALSLLLRSCTDTAQKWLSELKTITKNWKVEDGLLIHQQVSLGIGEAVADGVAHQSQDIIIDCGIQRAIKAEDYNPREDYCGVKEKKSFIM